MNEYNIEWTPLVPITVDPSIQGDTPCAECRHFSLYVGCKAPGKHRRNRGGCELYRTERRNRQTRLGAGEWERLMYTRMEERKREDSSFRRTRTTGQ